MLPSGSVSVGVYLWAGACLKLGSCSLLLWRAIDEAAMGRTKGLLDWAKGGARRSYGTMGWDGMETSVAF